MIIAGAAVELYRRKRKKSMWVKPWILARPVRLKCSGRSGRHGRLVVATAVERSALPTVPPQPDQSGLGSGVGALFISTRYV